MAAVSNEQRVAIFKIMTDIQQEVNRLSQSGTIVTAVNFKINVDRVVGRDSPIATFDGIDFEYNFGYDFATGERHER